ncbi:MAG: acetate/propionate family kinase [Mycoplasmataceae bacterium]|jgi:acetate kinase|nr:acetate/propionate family kinase [Mycoplasmataceae bacterium]
MSKNILIINAGSSSIKFKMFEFGSYHVIASGLCERIFIDGHFELTYGKNQKYSDNPKMPDHTSAITYTLQKLKELKVIKNEKDIIGIGHRIVMGGDKYTSSVLIDAKAKANIKDNIKLAPLHNEPELKVVEIFEKLLPYAKEVASFDTTFHTTIDPQHYVYPIDQKIAKQHFIRRYGFHGNSYRYITQRMGELLKTKKPNLVVCHLGNGASICAIKNGLSFNTSMGLTPLEGLMMGTRSGDVDPSLVIYLSRQGMSIPEIDNMLNKNSGLKAFVGSADMRDVFKKMQEHNQEATIAFNLYTDRVSDYIVRYINQMNIKIDAIVFTAGVGENSMFTVEAIIKKINVIKLQIDQKHLNDSYQDYKKISAKTSLYPIYCVRTDEELMIARDVSTFIK